MRFRKGTSETLFSSPLNSFFFLRTNKKTPLIGIAHVHVERSKLDFSALQITLFEHSREETDLGHLVLVNESFNP